MPTHRQRTRRPIKCDPEMLMGLHPADALDQTMIGWSLKPPKWARKKLRQVSKLAKKVGPVAAMVIPGAGPAIASATRVIDAAEKGDIRALGKISSIKALAETSPNAAGALQALGIARDMKRQVSASNLLRQARGGSPRAANRVLKISRAARAGSAKAREAFAAIKNANEGMRLARRGAAPTPAYAAANNEWVMQIVKTVGPAKPGDIPPWLSSGYEDEAMAILEEEALEGELEELEGQDELSESAPPSFEDEDITYTSGAEGGPISELLSLDGAESSDVDDDGELG